MENRITFFIRKKGISCRQLARAARLSAPYLSQLANGRRKNPSRDVMARIAAALGEQPDQVFL